MQDKLFVGGLSWDTDDQGLHQAFSRFGDIEEAIVIKDRDTGRSRGFGFVEMASAENAQAAISALNGHNLDGRDLTVNVAKERSR